MSLQPLSPLIMHNKWLPLHYTHTLLYFASGYPALVLHLFHWNKVISLSFVPSRCKLSCRDKIYTQNVCKCLRASTGDTECLHVILPSHRSTHFNIFIFSSLPSLLCQPFLNTICTSLQISGDRCLMKRPLLSAVCGTSPLPLVHYQSPFNLSSETVVSLWLLLNFTAIMAPLHSASESSCVVSLTQFTSHRVDTETKYSWTEDRCMWNNVILHAFLYLSLYLWLLKWRQWREKSLPFVIWYVIW